MSILQFILVLVSKSLEGGNNDIVGIKKVNK